MLNELSHLDLSCLMSHYSWLVNMYNRRSKTQIPNIEFKTGGSSELCSGFYIANNTPGQILASAGL